MQNKRDPRQQLIAELKRSQNKAERMLQASKAMFAVLGVLVLTVAFGAWDGASPLSSDHRNVEVLQRAQATPTGHKPGTTSDGPTVGKDVKNPATGKTHVCAGRKLLYNAHVDAIYGTYNKGKPDVMVVDGQQPVPADDVCLRLAPDAIDGKEASRIKVPNKKALSFLGKPGTVLWHAPQNADFTNQWRPIWAGLGAFDPAHELKVPTDFAEPNLHFHMKKFSGPGDMEVFFHNSSRPTPERVLSTKEGLKNYDYKVGGHGHFGWTFSKPGLYQLTMQWDVKKKDGSTVKSAARTINWLVGSDKQVGLPEGTTTGLNKIKKPIAPLDQGKPGDSGKPTDSATPSDADSGDESGSTEATEGETDGETGEADGTGGTGSTDESTDTTDESTDTTGTEEPGESAEPSGTESETESAPTCEAPAEIPDEDVRGEVNDAFGERQGTERAVIPKGHMDMGVGTSDESDADPHTFLKDGADPANVQERESGSFIFLVNSPKAKVGVPEEYQEELGETGYALPQAQGENPDVPWLGFSTEHLNSAEQGVDVTIKDFEGPGRMVTLSDNGLGSVSLRLDSEHREHKVNYAVGAHDHQQFLFTKPGAYRVVFRYQGTAVDGKKFDKELETFFVIKDSCGDDTGSGKSGLEELQELQKHLDSENVKIGKYMDQIVGGIEALRGNRKASQQPSTGGNSGASAVGTANGGASNGASNGASSGTSGTSNSGTSNGGSANSGDSSAAHGAASDAASSSALSGGGISGGASGDVSGGIVDDAAEADGAADVAGDEAEGDVGGGGIRRIDAAAQADPNNSAVAHSEDAQNVETKNTASESFLDTLTSGGWTTGFLLGLGLMGLLGGALLFFVAARNMQRAHTLQLLQAYREISRDRAEQAYAEGAYAEDGWEEGQA